MDSVKRIITTSAVLLAVLVPVSAHAQYDTYTLPVFNSNITTWTDGGVYSGLFSGTQTLGGIPFALATDASGNDIFNGGTLTINTNSVDASTVYTLINSAWGAAGSDVGSLTFTGSLGDTYTVDLVEGDNIRDHYYGQFVNTTSSPSTTEAVFGINAPGNAHLDMQTIALPSAFQNETLTSVVFNSNGGYPEGSPLLAGITVSAVPEADTTALLALGGAAVLLARRRQAK